MNDYIGIILLALLAFLVISPICHADSIADSIADDIAIRVTDPSWLRETAITTGMCISLWSYQAMNGINEGYHWGQPGDSYFYATDSNYHFYKTARDVTSIATGWFIYAQVMDSRRSGWSRVSKVVGAACIGRNVFEWNYKLQRYSNPFDYSHVHNEHALVYFGIRNGALVDMYIGTGPVSGPIVDAVFLGVGTLLLYL